jgi:hypothetical protein
MGDRRRLAPAAVACAAVAALAGCATLPTRGQALPVKQAATGLGQGTDFPQLIPAPPGKNWKPEQIVAGFLAASASFAQDHAFARQYLAGTWAETWNPGWAVTVVSGQPIPKLIPPDLKNVTKPVTNPRQTTVAVTGVQLASISFNGQYQQVQSGPATTITFSLVKTGGQWRITDPPNRLLLSLSEFHRVYQPRNLYYFDSTSTNLVPDPVFVPLQATTTDLATRLVKALGQQPLGTLQGAGQTSLPAGTKLLGDVKIEGTGAVVNLGGTIVSASADTLENITAQLLWTLTSASYGPSAITSVKLEINGQSQKIPGLTNGIAVLHKNYQGKVPVPSSKAGLYFVASDGTVQTLPASGTAAPQAVKGAAGEGGVPMTAIAVSPVGEAITDEGSTPALAGISETGRDIEFGALTKGAKLDSWRPGGTVTSLSWDPAGDLWAATSRGVWLLRPGGKAPIAVDLPFGSKQHVTALRVAPDGVRVAMIVSTRDSPPQVMVGAVTHSGSAATVSNVVQVGAKVDLPGAVGWYNADNLAVLGSAGFDEAQIDEVPVNGTTSTGTTSTELTPAAGALTMTVGGGGQIVVGYPKGRMSVFAVSTGSWRPLPPGSAPAFPG